MFVRVKDKSTRHEYDLPENHVLIRRGLVEVVKRKGYPPSRYPRRARHFKRLPLGPQRPASKALTSSGGGSSISEEAPNEQHSSDSR